MNRIKQLRTEKSLSLRDLAKDFSAFLDQHGKKPITNVTISRWENEKNSPTAEMWGLLADYFGVSVDYLCIQADFVFQKSHIFIMMIFHARTKPYTSVMGKVALIVILCLQTGRSKY